MNARPEVRSRLNVFTKIIRRHRLDTNIETTYKTTTTYLENLDDPLLKLVNQHEQSRKSYSIKKYADKFKKELNVKEIARKNHESVTKLAKRVKQHAKSQALNNIKQKWESKAIHGQYLSRIKEADVDFKQTNDWLKGTGLKAETEGLIIPKFSYQIIPP